MQEKPKDLKLQKEEMTRELDKLSVSSLQEKFEELNNELRKMSAVNTLLLWQIGQFTEECRECSTSHRECIKRNTINN